MPAFQPQHQGQQSPLIGKTDDAMQAALLTLTIMQRAAPADLPRYREKLRAQLQAAVDIAMRAADAFQR